MALRAVAVLVLAGAVPGAASSQQRPSALPSLVFDGVMVVDVEQGKLVADQRVVITGSRIETVGPASTLTTPNGAQVVDARSKYLIPGLWDMHTHSDRFTSIAYPLFLANGVTGVRDAASAVPLDTLVQWRREILAGTRVGPPRQVLSGKSIDQVPECGAKKGDPHPCAPGLPEDTSFSLSSLLMPERINEDSSFRCFGPHHHTCVADPDSAGARRLVDSLKAAGADMIKTYGLSRAMYFVIAAEARHIGMPFGGHLLWATAIEASDSGASILDHVDASGDLGSVCVWKEELPLLGVHPLVNTLAAVKAASVERCRPVTERFARNGTRWVPTMVVNHELTDSPRAQVVSARLERYARDFSRLGS